MLSLRQARAQQAGQAFRLSAGARYPALMDGPGPQKHVKPICTYLLMGVFLLAGPKPEAGAGDTPLTAESLSFSLSQHYLHAHHRTLNHLSKGHFPVIQAEVTGRFTGQRGWHHLYRFPSAGISFMYADLAYPEVLGEAYALIPFMRLPLVRGRHAGLYIRHGLGLAWLTHPFHQHDNYKNNAIGSHLNIAYQLRIEATLAIGPLGVAGAGLGMIHFSNGALRRPNRGINLPGLSVSYTYPFQAARQLPVADPPAGISDGFQLHLYAGGGISRMSLMNDTLMGAFSLSGKLSYPLSPKRRIGMGMDLFINQADQSPVSAILGRPAGGRDVAKYGVHLSYAQCFGQVDVLLHAGYYLRAPNQDFGRIYNRAAFRLFTRSGLFFQLGLKSHLFRASFVEGGLGYRIRLHKVADR